MLDRKTQPAFKKSTSFPLIYPEKIQLHNGLVITVVNGGEQEVVKIEFIFKAAKWHETHAGISYFTAHLLQKGTPGKSSYEISAALDQQGVYLEVSPGYDFTSIAVYGLTRNISVLFELVRDMITVPVFPPAELQQTKDIFAQSLRINLEKTSYLASRQIRQSLFGEHHPYGRDANAEDIVRIEPSQLSDFHTAHYGNVEVICSGKVTKSILADLSDSLSGIRLSNVEEKVIIKNDFSPSSVSTEKENSVQSSLRLARTIVSRTHPDYPSLLLLNHIFGGYFGSRLMKNIREEKGLTYGIYSSINALKHHSYISIGTDVNKENRQVAFDEIKNEMKSLQAKLIAHSELEAARNHFIGGLQAEIATSFAHADKIKNMLLFSLPDNYYQNLIEKIESLSPHDLLNTANLYLDPESFSTVSVG